MKHTLRLVYLVLFLSYGFIIGANGISPDYLKKVLGNLEKIESASYTTFSETWQPGDTIPTFTNYRIVNEYNNPKDTTIGASFVSFDRDPKTLGYGYNGTIRAVAYDKDKVIMVDDFTARPLPFRPLTPPFFNYAKSLIQYALTTNDSISLDMNDSEDHVYVKLTINESNQIEFFGKPYRMPDNPYNWGNTTSIYEIWIDKEKNLPYKVRREMSHNISATTCSDVVFNDLSIDDFNLYDHFPENYEIKKYRVRSMPKEESPLIGEKASSWTLNDKDEQSVSLSDFKGKVLLIQFTGIGCGPCIASIPFLNELKKKYNAKDVELLAIETWVKRPHALRLYSDKHNLNYTILSGTDNVTKDYKTGGAAPVFFILDRDQVIRKVINGYDEKTIKKELPELIDGLL